MNIKPKAIFLIALVVSLSLVISTGGIVVHASTNIGKIERPNIPLVSGDESWASNFMLGTDDDIDAVGINGNDMYVGGDFQTAGGIAASQIARYNTVTHQWSAMGSGVNNRVYAIVSNGRYVYVGGLFNRAGNMNITGLAVWDTIAQTWSPVGNTSQVHGIKSLALDAQGHLIAGGTFDSIGGISTENIAKWDGTKWMALGSGLGTTGQEVDSLVISGSDVYAGGNFTSAPSLYGVALWNGSSWSGLGYGVINSFYKDVYAVAVSGSNVYIGGSFDKVTDGGGDHSVSNIAVWNGSGWSGLGSGIDAGVYTLGVDGSGNLYAGGQYNKAGGNTVNKIAVWNGSTWAGLKDPQSLTSGTDTNVYSLVVSGNDLYAGGAMMTAGDFRVNHLAHWNITSQTWTGVGEGMDGTITAVAVNGTDIFAGGSFKTAGGVLANGIARWNDLTHNWYSLGSGLTGCDGFLCFYPAVGAILVVGNDIYVGGNFTSAGGVPAKNIARWNLLDQQWHALGSGIDCNTVLCTPSVSALVFDGSCVNVGGSFSLAGGITAGNLAVWCGNNWNNLIWNDGSDHIVSTNNSISTLAYDPSLGLYVGGYFTTPVPYVFSFDSRDGPLPVANESLNGAVLAVAFYSSNIVVGGNFTNASGVAAASYIAEQAGSNPHWSAVGLGLNNIVTTLAVQGSTIVAGGTFTNSGAVGVNHIARFNGSIWGPYGSGTDQVVNQIAADNSFIYVGGAFQSAGAKPASYFSTWPQFHYLYLPGVIKK